MPLKYIKRNNKSIRSRRTNSKRKTKGKRKPGALLINHIKELRNLPQWGY